MPRARATSRPPFYFTPAYTGGLARPLILRMRDWVSVKDFTGVYGDNANDDTAGVQVCVAAVAAANHETVFVPKGTYKISSAITVPHNKAVLFEGDGITASIIRQSSSTANGVVFTRDNYRPGGGLRNITVESGAGLQAADYFGPGSSGVGLYADGCADNFILDNVGLNNFAIPAALMGCWNTRHHRVRIMFFADTGLLIDKSGTIGTAGGNEYGGFKISNFGYTGTVAGTIGMRIRATGGEVFSGFVDITGVDRPIVIDPRAGDQVAYISAPGTVAADNGLGDGVEIDGTLGKVSACKFDDLWSGFNSGNGVVVKGANVSNIFARGRVRENAQHGILMQAGGFHWQGGPINNNSRGNSNTYDGVNVEADVSDWDVQNAFVGNDASSSNSHQRRGITIASGASDDFKVMGNTFDGNLTAPMSDGSSGTNKRVSSNLGYVTEAGGTGSIASGATTAVITHGLSVTPAAADIFITFTEQGTSDYGRWWISGITSTQFTLNVSADPGASNLDFSWSARCVNR